MTEEQQPYLSIVATTRNDDHGGETLARTQIFLDALATQCDRHGLDAELVLVEWNPPADRPGLRDALRWPEAGEHFEARIIEVPPSVHGRLEHADRLPLFQMIAKNVGIRRARGDFVLATNIDLIFSDELMQFLAERTLDERLLYRADRYDIDYGIPDTSIDDQLAWCEQHLIRIYRREGIYEVNAGRLYPTYKNMRVPLRLLPWLRLASWVGGSARGSMRFAWQRTRNLVRLRPRTEATAEFHQATTMSSFEDKRATALLHLRAVRNAWLSEPALMRLHTNACGDFTLMPREGWAATAGYPELEIFSMHIDSLLLYAAHYAGFRETTLPYRIYHMEHGQGFRPDDAAVKELKARLERKVIPQISDEQFVAWAVEMYRTKQPFAPNGPSWGFAEEQFREHLTVPRSMTRSVASRRVNEQAAV